MSDSLANPPNEPAPPEPPPIGAPPVDLPQAGSPPVPAPAAEDAIPPAAPPQAQNPAGIPLIPGEPAAPMPAGEPLAAPALPAPPPSPPSPGTTPGFGHPFENDPHAGVEVLGDLGPPPAQSEAESGPAPAAEPEPESAPAEPGAPPVSEPPAPPPPPPPESPSPPAPTEPPPAPPPPESPPEVARAAAQLESVADMLADDGVALPPAPSPVTAPPSLPAPPVAPPPPAPIPGPLATAPLPAAANAKSGENRGMFFLLVCIAALGAVALLIGNRTGIWLSLLGLNVVGTVGFNLMLRRLPWAHKDDWFTAAILQTGLMLPFLAKEVVRPITFPHHYVTFDYVLLATAVTCLISVQFCNVRALKNLEASVFSVVFNTRILFATIFGTVLLKESNHLLSVFGGLLIFTAIFLIRQKGSKTLTAEGVLFGLGAALSMSLMNTCEKELIMRVGYEQYIFPMFTIAAVILWGIVVVRPGRVQIPFIVILKPQSLLLMALRACAGIGFSYSLVFGPVAVSSYVSSLSVVFLVVFGMLFLGEWDYFKSKLLAASTALAGLTLILIDSFI